MVKKPTQNELDEILLKLEEVEYFTQQYSEFDTQEQRTSYSIRMVQDGLYWIAENCDLEVE